MKVSDFISVLLFLLGLILLMAEPDQNLSSDWVFTFLLSKVCGFALLGVSLTIYNYVHNKKSN